MKPPNVPCLKCGEVHWSREPCVTKTSVKTRNVQLGTQALRQIRNPKLRDELASLPMPKVIIKATPRGR